MAVVPGAMEIAPKPIIKPSESPVLRTVTTAAEKPHKTPEDQAFAQRLADKDGVTRLKNADRLLLDGAGRMATDLNLEERGTALQKKQAEINNMPVDSLVAKRSYADLQNQLQQETQAYQADLQAAELVGVAGTLDSSRPTLSTTDKKLAGLAALRTHIRKQVTRTIADDGAQTDEQGLQLLSELKQVQIGIDQLTELAQGKPSVLKRIKRAVFRCIRIHGGEDLKNSVLESFPGLRRPDALQRALGSNFPELSPFVRAMKDKPEAVPHSRLFAETQAVLQNPDIDTASARAALNSGLAADRRKIYEEDAARVKAEEDTAAKADEAKAQAEADAKPKEQPAMDPGSPETAALFAELNANSDFAGLSQQARDIILAVAYSQRDSPLASRKNLTNLLISTAAKPAEAKAVDGEAKPDQAAMDAAALAAAKVAGEVAKLGGYTNLSEADSKQVITAALNLPHGLPPDMSKQLLEQIIAGLLAAGAAVSAQSQQSSGSAT